MYHIFNFSKTLNIFTETRVISPNEFLFTTLSPIKLILFAERDHSRFLVFIMKVYSKKIPFATRFPFILFTVFITFSVSCKFLFLFFCFHISFINLILKILHDIFYSIFSLVRIHYLDSLSIDTFWLIHEHPPPHALSVS